MSIDINPKNPLATKVLAHRNVTFLALLAAAAAVGVGIDALSSDRDDLQERECDSQVMLTMYLTNSEDEAERKGLMQECMRLKQGVAK